MHLRSSMLPIAKEKTAPAKGASPSRGKPDFSISGNKVFFISLGCPRNLVDTEVMVGLLLQAGYAPAEQIDEADFIVINTCGFLEASRKESVTTIQDALKTRKSHAKVIATGCMVQTHAETIKKECPEIHYLLGSGDVKEILKAVEAESGSCISNARSFLEMGEVPRTITNQQHYAYLKIAEGCRKRCAFCIIPDIKGPLKSKPIEQVVKELNILLKQGVKEIILIAQDLGDWGKDLGYSRSSGIVVLLKALLEVKKDFWLRLLYLYPDEISDELIDVMASDPRICHYLDMPIQHVNNDILKAMRRATSKEDIIETLTKLRKRIPDIVIRSSVIVGFPGETEEQFEELLACIQEHPIDNLGIFSYSKEASSHSATLPNHLSEKVKQERLEKLAAMQQKMVKKRNKKLKGKVVEAVVEGYHPESPLLMRARYYGQCPEIDGQIIINDGRKVDAFGRRYSVEITDVAGYDLVGKVLTKK